MENKLQIKKRCTGKQVLLWAIASSFLVMLIVVFKIGKGTVAYETNNDRIINEIFSGAMTGIPDPHAICVNYILGIVISSLYQITKEIPWYGLFLLGCYFVINSAVLTVVLRKGKNLKEQSCLWFIAMFVILSNLYIFSVLQFTTIAGALAVAGYIWVLMDDQKKRSYIIFGVFELLAVLLRRDSMLMVQPIGCCIIAAFLLRDLWNGNIKLKTCIMQMCKTVLIVIGVLVIFLFGNYVYGDYSSTEWKKYTSYNDLHVQLVDYYKYPAYEDSKDILEKYDVSELEYEGIQHYYLLDNILENECMEELIPVAKEQYEKTYQLSAIGVVKRMINYFLYDKCFGYEITVPVMYIFVCFSLIFFRKWRELLPVVALLISRYTIFAYLIIRGRITTGVINILFFAELYFLLAIFVKFISQETMKKKKHLAVQHTASIVFWIMMLVGISRSYAEADKANTWTQNYENAIMKIFDYMEEKEGGFIVCDEVTTYYMGTALHTKRYKTQNSLVAGGWFYNSPMMNEAVETYKEKYSDNMYCVVFKDVPGFDHSYVLELIPQIYDVTLELEDVLYSEELGFYYEVYYLHGTVK